MDLLEAIIAAKLRKGGGEVTAADIVNATTEITDTQATQIRANIGAGSVNPVEVFQVSGTTPTIQAKNNSLFLFSDAVSSITISELPTLVPTEEFLFELVFLSGSTATEIIGPAGQSISLAEGCEIAADMVNDMSIRVCRVGGSVMALATVGTWEAPAAAQEVSA